MSDPSASPEQIDLADRALRFICGDSLEFTKSQITPQAAAFAIVTLLKVNLGARAAYALFELHNRALRITAWRQIPRAVWNATRTFLNNPTEMKKSRISVALIAEQHRRNLQYHLRDPEAFPCPEYWSSSDQKAASAP